MAPALLAALLALASLSAAQDPPRSAAAASDYQRTSTHAQVGEFLESLATLSHGDRLRVEILGHSGEGRALFGVAVAAADADASSHPGSTGRLRVLINANIHGGEVEGKEAVQRLLGELAVGLHSDLLEALSLLFVPVYNPDGNDRIAPSNRVSQNGPDGGVGERANAQGLDLNRDFIKVESPECRALLGVMNRWDPHVFMDLHTTNGSDHGYHLTYAPSLSTNVDADLDRFARQDLLPAVRTAMSERHGLRVFDYGNFSGRTERSWVTYDHRPRFGTNYVGLRNRLGVLSEAFSYLPFEERVDVTYAFVLETLRALAERGARVRALCSAADGRVVAGAGARFGWDSALTPGFEAQVLVGSLSSQELPGLGTRRVAGQEWTSETMRVRVAFEARAGAPLPAAWAVLEPSAAVTETLLIHGLEVSRLLEPAQVEARAFVPSEVRRASRPFQGHHELGLSGTWEAGARSLPAGTLLVTSSQPLGRLAAQLLAPRSEDGLSTWNFFEEATRAASEDLPGVFPVLSLDTLPDARSEALGPR